MLPTIFITSFVSKHWRKSPKKRSRSSWMNWIITLNSSRSDRAVTACWIVGLGSGVMWFYWFVSFALPFAAGKVVWWVFITTPISFDSIRPSTICVSFACARANAITAIRRLACLPELHGSFATRGGISDYFCKSLFHYGSIRYSHSKAIIGGGAIIEQYSGRGAVLRKQVSQPSRQPHSPSSSKPTPLHRATSLRSLFIFLAVSYELWALSYEHWAMSCEHWVFCFLMQVLSS